MATTISSSGTVGVTVTTASQNPVLVTGGGTINVAGAYASGIYVNFGIAGSITNDGLLEAPNGYGIFLKSGGTITNGSTLFKGAKITGGVDAVKIGIHGTGTVNNFGTIASTGTAQGVGVLALGNANVVNGSTSDTSALISGYFDGVEILGSGAKVSNFGTITATGTSTIVGSSSFGVYLTDGGTVTNGSATDTSARISGALFSLQIAHGPGAVVNFGTIKTTGPLGRGILLQEGGSVTNNVAGYIGASSRNGVYIAGPAGGSVTNLGTIVGGRTGVVLQNGGTVTNGSNADKTANITGGRNGVYITGPLPSAVNNFGTIRGIDNHNGVNLYLGGQLTNGSSLDTTALITGGNHGVSVGGLSTINNFGTITSTTLSALSMLAGGTVVNGSASDTVAKIAVVGTIGSHAGIYVAGGLTTIINFGTITSLLGGGVNLELGGGAITNGSAGDKSALIQGGTGSAAISVGSAPATVTNFGAVSGGTGIYANAPITIRNFGTVKGGAFSGIYLAGGGSITNGSTANKVASIIGAPGTAGDGIFVKSGPLTVANYGIISGGAQGINAGGVAKINNLGSITSNVFAPVSMRGGGTLINGSATNTLAKIAFVGTASQSAIFTDTVTGTITNFGLITGPGGISANQPIVASNFGTIRAGTYSAIGLTNGGNITNGSKTNTTASLIGAPGTAGNGIFESSGALRVANYGFISGGGEAIHAGGLATISNFGTITSRTFATVQMLVGGTVINGGTADKTARIAFIGTVGIQAAVLDNAGSATVSNFATIASSTGAAIDLNSGGVVINGNTADTVAAIVGAPGTAGVGVLTAAGLLAVTNFGTISGGGNAINAAGITTITNFGTVSTTGFAAIKLNGGGAVVNGSLADTKALIQSGTAGIAVNVFSLGATVTNFGTIKGGLGVSFNNGTTSAAGTVVNAGSIISTAGIAGTAISFGIGSERLVIDPGAVFIGKVLGGSGTNVLELAHGASAGTISGIGSQFSGFQQAAIDASATWNVSGTSNTIAKLTNNGTLGLATNGTLTVTGSIDPSSTGLFLLENSGVLEIAQDTGAGNQMKFINPSRLIVDTAAAFGKNVGGTLYTGPLIEDFGAGDSILLKNVLASGAVLNYSTASGLLQLTGSGTATLSFQNSSLAVGSFNVTADPSGHALITHS